MKQKGGIGRLNNEVPQEESPMCRIYNVPEEDHEKCPAFNFTGECMETCQLCKFEKNWRY